MSDPFDAAFVLVDKESGWTSHDVVANARGIFSMKKIGHAGTLDPMATGLVVLGLGRATRLLRFVQGQSKEYVTTARFGVATDSLDADGAVLDRAPMEVGTDDVATVAARFVGDIMQVPPMVSAVQVGGRRLYELAREGKEIDREARPVTIRRIEVEEVTPGPYPDVTMRVVCGTGTYIRTLADDIARALGGRAHLVALRRIRNGSLEVRSAWSIEDLRQLGDEGRLDEAVIHPADVLAHMPRFEATGPLIGQAMNGRRLPAGELAASSEEFATVAGEGRLIGVYRIEGKELIPEVVLG